LPAMAVKHQPEDQIKTGQKDGGGHLCTEEYIAEKGKGDKQHMVEEVFVGEIAGKDGVARPVEIVMGAQFFQELGHADMQVPVGAKEGGDGELSEENNADAEKNNAAQG